MSLQYNRRRRRRRSRSRIRLKREVIITIRVLLTVLVVGLLVFGSVNVYSYFNNKNKENVQEQGNNDELPIEPGMDQNQEQDTNSNNSSSEITPDNNIDNNEQDITNPSGENGESDKPNTDKPDSDKLDSNEPENNNTENNETNDDVTDNKKPDINEPDKDATSDSDSNKNDGSVSKKDESYFDDAVFIGDSRTEGLKLYSGLKNATFYAEKGLDVATIFKNEINVDGSKMTIIDALKKQSFGKVYINLGVNELGWPYDSEFIKHYGKVIDAIKEVQPDAEIYLQSIIHVTREKDINPPQYINNKTIIKRNKLLKELAIEKDINFIDPNEVLTDNNGYLMKEASVDGVHLIKSYCLVWKDFLIDNIIE